MHILSDFFIDVEIHRQKACAQQLSRPPQENFCERSPALAIHHNRAYMTHIKHMLLPLMAAPLCLFAPAVPHLLKKPVTIPMLP